MLEGSERWARLSWPAGSSLDHGRAEALALRFAVPPNDGSIILY